MTKKSFLKKLELRLKLLEEKERAKVIKKYELQIDKELKDGKEENEVIRDLGNVDDEAKKILKGYKISQEYFDKEENLVDDRIEDSINNVVNSVANGIRDFINKISEQDSKRVIEIALYILVFFFAFWLLKIPFIIVESIGIAIFNVFRSPVSDVFIWMWKFLLGVVYILLIIYTLVVIFNGTDKKITTRKRKRITSNIREEKEDDLITRYNNDEASSIVLKVLIIILQIVIVIMTLPLLFAQFGFLIALGILVGLLIRGVMVIGPILIIIALMTILGNIIGIIYHFTFRKGGLR